MAYIKQQLSFHSAVRDDARRYALTQALPQEIAAIRKSLERIVCSAIWSEAQKWIEAVKYVS
jgi:hypothetical protein